MSATVPWIRDVGWLKTNAEGAVLTRGGEGYDEARRVFNAMIDRHPALILRCEHVTDVVRGVQFARRHHLAVSVKGGGHSVAGSAIGDGGLTLDMTGMTDLVIDPSQRTAVAGAGLTLGQLDAASAAHGLATPFGVVSMTGIAGLTLGGGLGWLNGKHGLACDNLLAVDIVTADGRLRTADPHQHEDLYWAVRGGGGNFGAVVRFTYRLHPVTTVLAGSLTYRPGHAAAALSNYHDVACTSPDELSTAASVGRNDAGQSVVSVGVCWSGSPREGETVLRRLRAFGPPAADEVRLMPYVELQKASDGEFPRGRQHYWKASFLQHLPVDAIDLILHAVAEAPSVYSSVGLQQMTGVASRISTTATAFAHRARHYDFLILSQWDDPADSPDNIAWTRSLFDAMSPYLEPGVYMNNLGDEGPARVRDAYGVNYERLVKVKARYDPDNLFRFNHNVRAAPAHLASGRAGPPPR